MRPEKYHLMANELYQTRRPELAEQLTRDEGDVPYAYQDSAGYWTIGIGFLIDKEKGGRLPEAVKNFWLDYEISEKHKELRQKWPFLGELNQARQDVLLNMAFNLGVNGLLNFRKTIAYIEARDFEGAAIEMLDSRWAKQVGIRALRLSQQMKTGEYQ